MITPRPDVHTAPELRQLTRAQRRQMQKPADRVHRVTQADRRFFERRADRQHRVRLASQAEIEQAEIANGEPMTVPPGCRVFTIVKNIVTGARLRLFVLNAEGVETDVDEAVARGIWEAAAMPYAREVEARIRKSMEARS